MSFNVSKHFREETGETFTQPMAYQGGQGINLSEVTRFNQAAAYDAMRKLAYEQLGTSDVGITTDGSGNTYFVNREAAQQAVQQVQQQGANGVFTKPKVTTNRWAGRDELLKELNDIDTYSGYITDPEEGIRSEQRRREILKLLEEGDLAAGNGNRSYGEVDRARNIFTGASKDYGSGIANFFGTASRALNTLADKLPDSGIENYDLMASPLAETNTKEYGMQRADRMQATADRLGEGAQKDLESAKFGLSKFGQAGVDIATNVIQMGFDAGIGAITGGGALAPMFVRSAGSSAREARMDGAGLGQQVAYGTVKGGIEVLTEKMFDGVAKIYGAGAADELVERAIGRFAKSDTGRTFLRFLSNGAGEGIEEMVSDILSPIAEATYKDESIGQLYRQLDLAEILYDGLIGAAIGALGGGTSIISGQNAEANAELRAAEAGTSVRGNVNNAWDVLTGRATPEQVQAREQAGRERAGLSQEQVQEAQSSTAQTTQFRRQLIDGFLSDMTQAEELEESQADILRSGYETSGMSPSEYAAAVHAAYGYGKGGIALDKAQRDATREQANGELGLSQEAAQSVAFRNAWQIGRQKRLYTSNIEAGSVQDTLDASMSALGEQRQAAAAMYEQGQNPEEFAAEMVRAVQMASYGENIEAVAADDRDTRGAQLDILTERQIQAAKTIGADLRAARMAKIQNDTLFESIRSEAQRILDAENPEIGELNAAIEDAKDYLKQKDAELQEASAALSAIAGDTITVTATGDVQTPAGMQAPKSEAYGQALARVQQLAEEIRYTQEAVEQLTKERNEAREKNPGKRKKGTVTFGRITYKDGSATPAIEEHRLNQRQQNIVNATRKLADAVNLDFVFFYGSKGDAVNLQGGEYNPTSDTIYININAGIGTIRKYIAMGSISHELTHFIQKYAPEDYQVLKDFVIKKIMEKSPAEFNRMVRNYQNMKAYQEDLGNGQYRIRSFDYIADEMVANACMKMMENSEAIREFTQEHLTVAEKINNVIQQFIDRIKAAFAEIDLNDNLPLYKEMQLLQGEMDEIQRRWDAALRVAMRNYNAAQVVRSAMPATENAAQESGEVRHMAMGNEDAGTLSIKKQIKASKDILDERGVIAKATVTDMPKGRQQRRAWVVNKLKSTGYAVDNIELGRIEFIPRQINTGIDYLNEPGEIAAFAVLPSVLKRGVIIDRHDHHKGNARDSITIAGKVDINGVQGYMAVALTKTTKTHYHTHRIVMPDGTAFVFDEKMNAEVTPAQDQPKKANISGPSLQRSASTIAEIQQAVNENDAPKTRFMMMGEASEEDLRARMAEIGPELNSIRDQLKALQPEQERMTQRLMDDEITVDDFKKWEDGSGAAELYRRQKELQQEASALQKAWSDAYNERELAKERAAIEKSGAGEAAYFAKQAVKEFGTTTDYNEAGYLMQNGKMLNFSGEKGVHPGFRGEDHRSIGAIFAGTNPSENMMRFIGYGNIRIIAESPGLTIASGTEPTAAQYRVIKDFVRESADKGAFYVDLSNTSDGGIDVVNLHYSGRVNADRVVNDLKHFFETGEVREQGVSSFYMRMDEGEQMMFEDFDPKYAGMHPTLRARQIAADELTGQIRDYFDTVDPDSDTWLSPYDLDELLHYDRLYNTFYDAGTVYLSLLQESAGQGPRKRTGTIYPMMEGLLQRMPDGGERVLNMSEFLPIDSAVSMDEAAEAFRAWYNKRHPSLYYEGYQPGDLFDASHADVDWYEDDRITPEEDKINPSNTQKERDHLRSLLKGGKLMEPELSQAREMLRRLENPTKGEIFYQAMDEAHNDWAPEFYSQMQKTVDEWTNDKGRPMPAKMAGNAVIPWLRGRGVKAEEIRWSGLQPWLEGRKSVTKEELQEFLENNQLEIQTKTLESSPVPEETTFRITGGDYDRDYLGEGGTLGEILGWAEDIAADTARDEGWEEYEVYADEGDYNINVYIEYVDKDGTVVTEPAFYLEPDVFEQDSGDTHWSEYTLEGGINYREILFKLPGLSYDNRASRTHWKDDAPGTIAHARVQDMERVDDGGRVLFIEEIQSDLHNEGASNGYSSDEVQEYRELVKQFQNEIFSDEKYARMEELENKLMPSKAEYDALTKEREAMKERVHYLGFSLKTRYKRKFGNDIDQRNIEKWIGNPEESLLSDDYGFFSRDSDRELNTALLMRSLLTEEERSFVTNVRDFDSKYAPAWLKYRAEKRAVESEVPPDVPFAGSADTYHEYVMKHLLRLAAEGGYDAIGWTTAQQQADRWSDDYMEGYRIEYDQTLPKFMNKYCKQWGVKVTDFALAVPYTGGEETRVWGVEINDAMRESVLTKGQPRFMSMDEGYDDTAEEGKFREESWANLEAMEAINEEIGETVTQLTRGQKKSLGAILDRLRIGLAPEARRKFTEQKARAWIRDYGSTVPLERVVGNLEYLYNYVLRTENPSTAAINEMAQGIAQDIVENALVPIAEDERDDVQQAKRMISGAKLVIDARDASNIGGVESLREFNRRHVGKFSVAQKGGRADTADRVSVDTFYEQLRNSEGIGHLFPEANNPGEMLENIAAIYEMSDERLENPFQFHMGEVITELATEISRSAWWDSVPLEQLTQLEQTKVNNAKIEDRINALQQTKKLTKKDADALRRVLTETETLTERNLEMEDQIRRLTEEKALSEADAAQLRAELQETERDNLSRTKLLAEQIKKLKEEKALGEAEANRLYNEVSKLTSKLDSADRRYNRLKAKADERLSQTKIEGRARTEERVAKERAKAAERIADLKEHYQEMQRNARERRENTDTRHKIRRLIDQLNSKLVRPTEKRHVPRELVRLTIDVLEMLDYDSGRGGQNFADKIAKIRNMYDNYKSDPVYNVVYDEVTAEMLQRLTAKVGDGNIYHMTQGQLDAVYDTLKSLNHVIDEAVKVRIGNEERNAYELAQQMTQETRDVPKAQRGWLKTGYLMAHLRADVAFRRFAWFKKNSAWEQMARMLNDGQLKQTEIQMRLSRPFADLVNDEAAMRDFMGLNTLGMLDRSKLIDIGLKDENGEVIPVTHGIALGIYMDLLNEGNARHFVRGGKTIPNLKDYYNGKGGFEFDVKRAVGFSDRLSEATHALREARDSGDAAEIEAAQDRIEQVKRDMDDYAASVKASIEQQMTDFDRQWIERTQFLMDVSGKRYLNDTTMEVYGIQKASVANYFPITTDPNFTNKPMDSITTDFNLENAGFMKERVQAANPTLALDISMVVNKQINRVAQYSGLMPAIRNFNKVYNKMGTGYSDSLKNALTAKFGKAGTNYVENLIADLSGGRREAETSTGLERLLGALRGNLAQTTLTLNLRVSMAQAASYPTAAAELGWKPLVKALARGGKSGRMISRADKELIAKYSPLLYLRMQGFSSVELGDIRNSQKLAARLWKKARWATGWIQAVDGATVGRLWYAAEYWVQDNMPNLQKGTDAYYEAVAKKFNDVTEKTQPNYTPMQRAAMLRDPNTLVKTLTMFMTQRLQNFNILFDAAGAYQKVRADRSGGRNSVTDADVAEAKQNLAWAISSQVAQAATFVAFKLIADALMHNLKAYRDDDDGELTKESVGMQLLNNYIDAVVGCVWLGSEIYSILKTVLLGEKWYGLSMSGVDSLNDLIDTAIAVSPKQYDLSTDKGKQKYQKAISKFALAVAQVLGIPANNGMKIGTAIQNWAKDYANGELGSFNAGYELTSAQQKVRDAEAAGIDKNVYLKVMDEADPNGSSPTQAELYRYLEGSDYTAEEKQKLWAAKGASGSYSSYDISSTVKAETKEQFMSGAIDRQAAGKALTESGIKAKDALSLLDKWAFEKKNGWSYDNMKAEYMAGNVTAQQAKNALTTIGKKSPEAAQETIDDWNFEKKYGAEYDEYGLTTAQAKHYYNGYNRFTSLEQYAKDVDEYGLDTVKNYYDGYRQVGLTLPQYNTYRTEAANCKGTDLDRDGKTDSGSKKAQLLAVINRLPVSTAVKDALYEKNGWSMRTLYEAPWH